MRIRLGHKISVNGRRGAFQLMYAIAYVVIGLRYAVGDGDNNHGLDWLDVFVDVRFLAIPWLLAAALAVYGAFRPRPDDHLAFAALAGNAVLWGWLSIISWLAGDVSTGWGAINYWVIGLSVMIVSGMNGPTDADHREIAL